MPYFRLYYHVVFATKGRAPNITPELESVIYQTILRKSRQLDCVVHALNGIADHIHIAVTIPPKLSISDYVRQVKGVSSREANQHAPDADERFRWQKGFSVHSYGQKVLSTVVQYIEEQKQHHSNNTVLTHLEYIQSDE